MALASPNLALEGDLRARNALHDNFDPVLTDLLRLATKADEPLAYAAATGLGSRQPASETSPLSKG